MSCQPKHKAIVTFVKTPEGLKVDMQAHGYILYGTVTFDGLHDLATAKPDTSGLVHNFTQVQRRVPFNAATLAAGKYTLSGRVKENGELDFVVKDRSGVTLTSFICDEPTPMGAGTFSGDVNSPPKLGLGAVNHYSDYSDNLVSSILQAAKGGSNTTDYFNKVNNMSKLFQKLADHGRSAWNNGTDDSIGLPTQYISYTGDDNVEYHVTIRQEEVQQDGDRNVVINGSKATIKGVTYNGIGMITMTCGYGDFDLSKTCWWMGIGLAGSVPVQLLWKAFGDTIKSVAGNVADQIKALFDSGAGGEGGEAAEDAIEEADAAADTSIEAEVSEVAIEEVVAEGIAISLSEVFIGAALVLAIVFLVLVFIFHNSYHSLRVWNLTEYKLDWTIHFDAVEWFAQGELVSGPVKFKSGTEIDKFLPFLPVSNGPPVHGARPVNSCHYGDLHINSSHTYSGIGYVLQFSLKDDNNNVQYKATAYFDLPLVGDNSTNVSLDPNITELQAWYSKCSGDNRKTQATTTSTDGNITLSTTYDYLGGEHDVPGGGGKGSSGSDYYYQSVLTIVQNNMSPSALAARPTMTQKFVPVEKQKGRGLFNHINPAYRKHVMNHIKNRKTTAGVAPVKPAAE